MGDTRPSPPAVDIADPPPALWIPLKLVFDFHCFAQKLFRNDASMFAVRFATRLDYACLNPFLVPLFTLEYCTFQMNVKLMTSIVSWNFTTNLVSVRLLRKCLRKGATSNNSQAVCFRGNVSHLCQLGIIPCSKS